MTVGIAEALSATHREAVEQLRAGDHNTFLVGFLTTSTMLEISNLAIADLGLDEYAHAAAQIITQFAPLDRVRLELVPVEIEPVVASIGTCVDGGDGVGDSTPQVCRVAIEGTGSVVLTACDIPAPLAENGFLDLAAEHIAGGFRFLIEAERRRRRAAFADTLALVAALDDRWNQHDLGLLARAISVLPGVRAATIRVRATRPAYELTASCGELTGCVVERSFTIDQRVAVDVTVAFPCEPALDQLDDVDSVLATLAVNLSRIEQNLRLADEAETDQLTGLANRRRVSRSLMTARELSDRTGRPFAVLLCDLDHFKAVNDERGHSIGDTVLVNFADLLTENAREQDTVARWGGEEFMVVCPDCGMAEAIALGQQIIERCPDAFVDVLGPDSRQTTSVGIAVYPDHGRNPEMVIRAADDSLYRAKRAGRNQVSTADDLSHLASAT